MILRGAVVLTSQRVCDTAGSRSTHYSEGVVILRGVAVLTRWQENVMLECFPSSV